MKKSILFALCSILFFVSAATAQDETNRYGSSRLNNLLDQLKRVSVDLVDRTSDNVRGRNPNRSDIEAAFLAQQLDASVGFFQEFARDGRRASELRDAASVLSDLLRRAPSYGLNSNLWRDAQNTVSDINREIGNNNGNSGGGGGNNNPRDGRATWRGRIDDNVQLVIQGSNIETRRISGKAYAPGTFDFSSPLPTRNVTVDFQKNSGRSTNIRVLQQPSRNNNYTAIIQIIDEPFGAGEYDLEIFWQ